MGAVYRGEQVHLRKQVAIKLLRPLARRMPELVVRFEREAVAGAHIRHPNVVAAIDFGQLDDASFFLVLEYVEGTPLKEAIAGGRLAPARALRIARQIASALAAAHEKGIVHRDVKPQNVLLDAHDQVRLIDFGLAKVNVDLLSSQSRKTATPSPALTSAGEVFGTLAYLAPEALRGMDAVDARGPVRARARALRDAHRTAPLRHEERGRAAQAAGAGRAAGPPRARSDLEVPYEVQQAVMRLMEHDPAFRFQTAADAIAALDEGSRRSLVRRRRRRRQGADRRGRAGPVGREPTRRAGPPWREQARASRQAEATAGRATAGGANAAGGAAAQAAKAAPREQAPSPPGRGPGRPCSRARTAGPRPRRAGCPSRRRSRPWRRSRSASRSGSSSGDPRRPRRRRPSPPSSSPPAPPAPPPPASASAAPEDDARGAPSPRAQLSRAVATRNWMLGARSLLALAEADPELALSRACAKRCSPPWRASGSRTTTRRRTRSSTCSRTGWAAAGWTCCSTSCARAEAPRRPGAPARSWPGPT